MERGGATGKVQAARLNKRIERGHYLWRPIDKDRVGRRSE